MANVQSVFIASTLKSEQSKVARVMEHLNLDRVVYFVVRDPSTHKRSTLYYDIRPNLIARLPVDVKRHPKAHRMLVVCNTSSQFSDAQYIEEYRYLLRHIFGPKCRYAVRVCHRYTYLV